MERKLLFISFLVFSVSTFSCEVNPKFYQPNTISFSYSIWDNVLVQWTTVEEVHYNRDPSCQFLDFLSVVYGDTGMRGPMFSDNYGRLEQMISYGVNVNDTAGRFLFTYDANGNVDTVYYQVYNHNAISVADSWQQSGLMSYTYHNGLLSSYRDQFLDTVYKDRLQEYYHYDSSGRQIELDRVFYPPCCYDSNSIYTYYDQDGNKTIQREYRKIPTWQNWEETLRAHYTCDSMHNIIGEIDSTWNTQLYEWQLESKKTFINNTDGLPIEILTQVPDTNSTWKNSTHETYDYCSAVINSISSLAKPVVGFNLSPNPATNYVNIAVDEAMAGSILTITDITGRKMTGISLTTQHSLLNTDFPNGIYFVTISNGQQTATQKLIIQK